MKKAKVFIIISVIVILALLAAIIGGVIYILNMDFETYKDGLEIERKWLISAEDIPHDLEKADAYEIYQTYINYSPEIRVRKIKHEGELYYSMAIKRYTDDETALVREETEFMITEEEYNATVGKGLDNTVHKTRYQIEIDGITYSFDIFHDQLNGLAYAEVEFCCEEEADAFKVPDWFGKDVTNDRSYKNQSLAQHGIPQK